MIKTTMSSRRRQWSFWVGIFLLQAAAMAVSESAVITTQKDRHKHRKGRESSYPPPVQLHREKHQVVLDNGLVNITLSVPQGEVTGIQYNGVQNLLEEKNKPDNRGYWDVVWQHPGTKTNIIDKLEGTEFTVIVEDESQVEVSFSRTFDRSGVPLNTEKRFILLRGCSGFYTYGIFERLEGWPDFDLIQGRTVFKLGERFTYMAISDERQRIMPTAEDRERGEPLAYPEAVLLAQPTNSFLKGEVDDKYQYSCDDKDCRVHGWITPNPNVGFWMITPSIEFKTGGPLKQDLTSHVGPTVLSMFFSNHYAGEPLEILFRDGEPWKKVFGPVLIYLNSAKQDDDPLSLWADAKGQMLSETESWPYNFVHSEDYPLTHERGRVSGRLLVRDRYISYSSLMTGSSAYVGLAPPGDVGSWQQENKGYQFWTQADDKGYFVIRNIRPGNYSVYAWVPGFIGDYKYQDCIIITSGIRVNLGNIIYEPPRSGPTLWEIGIPDRTALEFYIPDPNPGLMNQLYSANKPQKFRQYGLWDRYTDLYPTRDLAFTIGIDDYQKDWFFAQVNRISDKSYIPTTWRIIFDLKEVDTSGAYTLQLALASACEAELLVRINSLGPLAPQFTTNLIGKDNSIARHGIHGLYLLYNIQIPGSQLNVGSNTIFLTQTRGVSPWKGLMYDYIRLEGPPVNS